MQTKKRPWLKIQIPLSITDGNFGAPSGMVELQVRSHQGFIDILQALPADLPGGYIRGVCVRGGFELDMEWKTGKTSEFPTWKRRIYTMGKDFSLTNR